MLQFDITNFEIIGFAIGISYLNNRQNVISVQLQWFHTYIHTYLNKRTYSQTYLHTYMHMYLHVCMHLHLYMYIHTYKHTHLHAYSHTYVHTSRGHFLPLSTYTKILVRVSSIPVRCSQTSNSPDLGAHLNIYHSKRGALQIPKHNTIHHVHHLI